MLTFGRALCAAAAAAPPAIERRQQLSAPARHGLQAPATPYSWLRDESPGVVEDHMTKEHAFAGSALSALRFLQEDALADLQRLRAAPASTARGLYTLERVGDNLSLLFASDVYPGGQPEAAPVVITDAASQRDGGLSTEEAQLLLQRGVVVAFVDVPRELSPAAVDTFLQATAELVGSGMADPGRIVALSDGEGAVVAAAAVNRRPQWYQGAVLSTPVLDVRATVAADPASWAVFGDPTTPEGADNAAAVCPQANVSAQPYPPVLLSALSLRRAWEPLQFAATVRHETTSKAFTLLRVLPRGASREDEDEEMAWRVAFAVCCMATSRYDG